MSKADGSVIIDTKMDTSGVEKGSQKTKEELSGIGEEAEKTSKSIGGIGDESSSTGKSIGGDLADGFKKLGKVIVSAKVVEKLYEFGKQAVSLGSELEEVQNVVDVTFTTMSKKVNKFAKDAKKSAGLSETMAKQYVGTFGAMADSFGFTEAQAYEMSTALTQLTGDVASFYNISQDEAATKLKGVFTGETEALKELGVVMTQSALDAYAMANGFGKTTSAMTEQEKVALRYQFVMDQLSSASGDFVRTQDGWANQSRILQLQWESLLATLGTGLISVLSPSISFINDKVLPALQNGVDTIAELMEPPDSAKLEKSLKRIASSVEKADEAFQASAEAIDNTAIKAEIYRGELIDLEAAGLDTADAQSQYAHIVERLNELYPDLNLRINENTGMLDENSRANLENLETMKERAYMAAVEQNMNDILYSQYQADEAVRQAELALIDVRSERKSLTEQITRETGLEIDELYELDVAQRKGENTTTKLTASQKTMLLNITLLKGEEIKLTEAIKDGKKESSALNDKINDLAKAYGLAGDDANQFADDQDEVTQAVTETQSQLETLQSEFDDAKDAAYRSISSQVGLFDELTVKSSSSASQIIKNWESQQAAFDSYKANLEKAVDMGLDEALIKQLSDGSTESMAILDEFVNNTDVSVDDINTAFQKVEESKETVSATMADIQTDMSGKLAELSGSVSTAWGDMAYTVKNQIQRMQNSINSLRGKTVTLSIKTGSSGSSGGHFDINSGMPISYALENASVPYLAKGTVIPPNAPFMAVLGDQRRGTNIEAPLSTIQEAVAMVMEDQTSGMMRGFDALLEESRMLRNVVECISIGDETIALAMDRYSRKKTVMLG